MAGISLGGWLALDYAIRRPERVETVAASARGKPSAPDVRRMRQTQADGTTRQPGADRSHAYGAGLYGVCRVDRSAFPAADNEAAHFLEP